MSDCVALLKGPLTVEEIEGWSVPADFRRYVIHHETLKNVSSAAGPYTADPFSVKGVDIKDVEALILFDCDTGIISKRGIQMPALGLFQNCADELIVCLTGWCEIAPTLEEIKPKWDFCEDACERYKRLACKLESLVCDQEKVQVTFRDRTVRFQPKSEYDKELLREWVEDAKAECMAKCNPFVSSRGVHVPIC